MVLQYLIHLPVLGASLALLLFFKSDITLYLSIALVITLSIRTLFSEASPASRATLFLIQAVMFGMGMWYALFPERFAQLLMLLGL